MIWDMNIVLKLDEAHLRGGDINPLRDNLQCPYDMMTRDLQNYKNKFKLKSFCDRSNSPFVGHIILLSSCVYPLPTRQALKCSIDQLDFALILWIDL